MLTTLSAPLPNAPKVQCVGVVEGDNGLDREDPRPAAGEPWLKPAQPSHATIGAGAGLVLVLVLVLAENGVLQT